jgi:hypothetical protein
MRALAVATIDAAVAPCMWERQMPSIFALPLENLDGEPVTVAAEKLDFLKSLVPFTMSQQGAGRLLQGRGRAGHGLCGGRQRRDRRPCSSPALTSYRSMSLTCRRGLRRLSDSASKCWTARSKAIGGIAAMHICFGYAAVIHNRPRPTRRGHCVRG